MNGFAALQRRLASLSDPRTLAELHNLAGRDVAELVDAGFAGEHDPNGDPWLPSRAAQKEGRKTLRKIGNLQDGIQWKADSRGVVFQTTGKANRYARYHQDGTRRMPQRQFLPEGEIPLPYERKLVATFRDYFQSRFG
ncbi:hypothetical protein E7T06_07280 [Deinococcus sp. Arct2-2]|uniref:phage virion morphogenesis protein n=1 Tax=Deinococcus sp. Arct2-2 TaxID=2568653 RepID=UPI0010A4D261|nr:phage virion morphogenesis protein [Deinococcus sp. Arct2-2]THF70499.1 hypothetical protein E7T06_07280 [Deinococcus sp. Arct2-2]